MNWKAARVSTALSLLFLLIYGSCNYLTAHRQNIGSCYFSWEKRIPFLPWMILPYMSIDLFFIAAPFFCRTDSQLKTLAWRVITAIVVSGVFFLCMPLRFAFGRPFVTGPLGLIFNNFRLLDQPYNQFPSLHIALLFILAPVYTQQSKRWWIWFVLIGASTLLTFQHHVIDIVGGSVLATMCCYLFRSDIAETTDQNRLNVGRNPEARPCGAKLKPINLAVGLRYLLGSLLLILLALLLRPIGLLLLWPGLSLAIVASGYFGFGAAIFRKSNGRVPLVTILILWPPLLGQFISLLHYRRQCDPWNVLTDRIWIGRKLNKSEATKAVQGGVTAVLDLTGEFSEAEPFRELRYLQVPVLDLTAPSSDAITEAIDFIASVSGVVYIHCKIGYSRTAAVAGCHLLATGSASTVGEALATLRGARSSIIIRPEAVTAITRYTVPPDLKKKLAFVG